MKKILRGMYKRSIGILGGRGLQKYSIIRAGNNFLKSHLKSNFVEIDGHKMFLDSLDSLSLSTTGVHEELETEFVKKAIKKGDVVIDIGANIGYFTLIFARLVGDEGKVYAFEPEPANFNLLKKNVETNGYQNVVLVRKAVLDKTGKTKLYIASDTNAAHRITDAKELYQFRNQESIEIDSVRLDDYFRDYNQKINFIKIDIEGVESVAIKGMSSLLRRMNDIKVMVEFVPYFIKKLGIEPEEFIQLLKEFDFKIYHFDRKKGTIKPVDLHQLLDRYKPEKLTSTNLLCVKGTQIIDMLDR